MKRKKQIKLVKLLAGPDVVLTLKREVPPDLAKILEEPDHVVKNYAIQNNLVQTDTTYLKIEIRNHKLRLISMWNRYTLGKNGVFPVTVLRRGFEFDGKTLTRWFGTSVEAIATILKTNAELLGIEWLNFHLLQHATKGVIERILGGKLTNNKAVARAMLVLLIGKEPAEKVNYNNFITVLESKVLNYSSFKFMLLNEKYPVKLINFLASKTKSKRDILVTQNLAYHDLVSQARILGVKVSALWSDSRIMTEHRKNTVALMNKVQNVLSKEKVEYTKELLNLDFPLKGARIIDNEKDAYIEGTAMSNCVFTNYWGKIQDKTYLIVAGKAPNGKHIDIGIGTSGEVEQIFYKGNKPVEDEISKPIKRWFEQEKVKTIIKENIKPWNPGIKYKPLHPEEVYDAF